ncbi:PKD-like domain-containing protein [Flaviaesturariibacter aridisoli]|uniref:PKD domain-containing protein n=1 Tax=Flaviaesturariibacter aridisoli TaxID=2545761 RepID=A0A4R4E192_9BACT|nr:PKD-like domain-containing protein [Flaviaesturariibacter aridisoli]TCZ73166.1 PKD domain-containing protein [Flaviaesturariibacter aridisoli]
MRFSLESTPAFLKLATRHRQRLLRCLCAALLLLAGCPAGAQNYTYSTETFDVTTEWPQAQAQAPATESQYVTSTGAWRLYKGYTVTGSDPCSSPRALRFPSGSGAYLVSPPLAQGCGVVTFNDARTNRVYTYYTSTDNGATWSAGTNTPSSGASCATVTITINNPAVNRFKLGYTVAQDAGVDNFLITTATIVAPTVTTTAASAITFTSASAGGNVTSDGFATVSDRGVVWSTTANPSTGSNLGITHNGTGTGAFTSALSGLAPSTTYHYRAFATNSIGTSYGSDLTFTTPVAVPTLTASPASLDWGNVTINTTATMNYSLSGVYLSPAAGNISITAPSGYGISTSPTGPFGATATVAYTGSTLAATTLYVQFAPGAVGALNGTLVNSGGGGSVNVALAGAGAAQLAGVTNVGFDFWTGFGYQVKMEERAGDSNEARMSIYISVPQGTVPASVRVELPGIPGAAGFPQVVTVNPGTVSEVTGFPTGDPGNTINSGGFPDTRLYATGVTSRGVHIYSTNGVPISVWMHTYAPNNSAAGAILFPSNTWSSNYTVQAYGGVANDDNPASYFFVIAKEDNTPIWFTPSQDVVDSTTGSSGTIFNEGHTAAQVKYHAGTQYGPIILNKGQIFNAMGFIQGSGRLTARGLDLSGSVVKTDCNKSIAVFGGNGRVLVNASDCNATTGSDHMIQQMFPSVAWGKRYLTAPTKTMEYNVFRVNVTDPATQVRANGTLLTGIINNLYYEFASNQPQLITGDRPISVTQFITAEDCAVKHGANGMGDPEMIILSPVEQAITTTTVYSAPIKRSGNPENGHYINVIIPQGGVASFRLDGAATADPGADQTSIAATFDHSQGQGVGAAYGTGTPLPISSIFQPHPQLAGYAYATFQVTPRAAHTLSSDSAFNAIAYGVTDGESYAYNAGAAVKDLSQQVLLANPYGVSKGITCKGNDFYFRIALPYAPADLSSLSWNFFNNPALTPNANVLQNNPTPDSTYTVDGVPYYVYRIPTSYRFAQTGTHTFQVLANALTGGGCTGTKVLNNSITVTEGPKSRFEPVLPSCGGLTVQFNDVSTSDSTAISSWTYNFGDGATLADTSHLQNPSYTYPSRAPYSVTLRAVNAAGCFADTTRVVDISGAFTPALSVTPGTTVCAGNALTFTNTSTASGTFGTIVRDSVDFGDGSPIVFVNGGANTTHTYTTAGTYTVTYQAATTAGCRNTPPATFTVTVNAVPSVTSAATGTICTGNAQSYTLTSGIAGSTYSWSRPAVAGITNAAVSNQSANPITESLVNSTNAPVVVTYTIVPTATGCPGAAFTYSVTVYPSVAVTSAATGTVCSGTAQSYALTSNVAGATFSWSRPAVTGISNAAVSNQTTGTITEALVNTTNAPVNVAYTITPSLNGCPSSAFTYNVTVNPVATVTSAAAGTVCSGTPQNYPISGNTAGTSFSWSRPAVAGISNAAVSNQTSSSITETLTNTTAAPVSATYTITPTANGCAGTAFTYTVTVAPTATVSSAATASVCTGVPFSYSITSAVAAATFSWSRPAVAGISNVAATGQTANPISETLTNTTGAPVVVIYNITPSANGCAGTPFTLSVTVNPSPTATFTFANNSCANSAVNFTANATGAATYSWNYGDNTAAGSGATSTHTYNSGGSFNASLTVTSASGCTFTTSAQAVAIAAILANPVVTADAPQPNALTFRWPAVTGATSYEVSTDGGATWVPANGAGGTSHTVSGLQPNQTVNIQVRALGALACQTGTGAASATTLLPDSGVFVPNTFSPNGDGHNDVLKVYGNFITAIEMRIFNQWGQQIAVVTNPGSGWDGTYQGRMQPVGVYAYVIKVTLQNGQTQTSKGLFNLIR